MRTSRRQNEKAMEIKDCEKMTDGQLLRELVRRFMEYDRARDKFINFLCSELAKAGINYEGAKRWDRLHMAQDEKFCQVREICRIVKKDPDLLWC